MAIDITLAQATGITWTEFERAMRAVARDMDIRQVSYAAPDRPGPDDVVVTLRLIGRKR